MYIYICSQVIGTIIERRTGMENVDKLKQQQADIIQEKYENKNNSVHPVIDNTTLINRSYVYEFASEAYCRDHGTTRKEVIGRPLSYIWGEANFNKYIKKNLDRCFTGHVVRYENWLEFPGQGARYYRVSYSPYANANGDITHAVVAYQDITELKTEQDSIEKSEAGFKTILRNMHYGVFTFDAEGRFTFVNDVVIQRSGYPRKWYSGKTLFDVVRPHERASIEEHFRATVRGEQVPPYEFSYLRAANDVAWVNISTTPIREEGRIVGVLGVLLDATKLMRSEQALKESEKKYRTLFEDSRDAIFITDSKGIHTDVNSAYLKLFGYTKEETQSLRAIDTYVNREDCKVYMKAIEENGFFENFRTWLKKKDGATLDCLLNGTPIKGPEGDIEGYQGIIRVQAGEK
jgi:PAS domain S-box-containing protein